MNIFGALNRNKSIWILMLIGVKSTTKACHSWSVLFNQHTYVMLKLLRKCHRILFFFKIQIYRITESFEAPWSTELNDNRQLLWTIKLRPLTPPMNDDKKFVFGWIQPSHKFSGNELPDPWWLFSQSHQLPGMSVKPVYLRPNVNLVVELFSDVELTP